MTEFEIRDFIKENLTIGIRVRHHYRTGSADDLEVFLNWKGDDDKKPFISSSINLDEILP